MFGVWGVSILKYLENMDLRIKNQVIRHFMPDYATFLSYTLRSTATLRAAVERADTREFIAHAARGRTSDESHSPIRGRWLSARWAS